MAAPTTPPATVPATAPTVLVWMAPEAPDAQQNRAVVSWGRARGVRLVAARDEAPAALTIDPRLAEDVEALLDRARDAMAQRDGEAVDRAIDAAASTLAAHPELPQGAWLMAEVERARSTRLQRVAPVDPAAAAAAWARAEAIDGGRVAGVGEPSGLSSSLAPEATLSLPTLPPGATLLVDGAPAPAGTLTTRAGRHALIVSWRGSPVRARWIDAPAGPSSVDLTAPLAPPCSTADVAQAHAAGAAGIDASGVRCAAWVAAIPNPSLRSGIRVATCEAARCGPWTDWRAPVPWTYDPPHEPSRAGSWPSWATWGLIGAGAVVTGGIVVLASGVLKPAPTETQFVGGGVRTQ